MKKVKFLLPVLATALLLAMSSVSCASSVKGKTYKHESEDVTVSFITKSDFKFKHGKDEIKGTYRVEKKEIFIKIGEQKEEKAFTIISASKLKDTEGKIWNKI